MKRFYPIFIAILFLPFCGNRKNAVTQIVVTNSERAAIVELDMLRFACERRLSKLEMDTVPRKVQRIIVLSSLGWIEEYNAIKK